MPSRSPRDQDRRLVERRSWRGRDSRRRRRGRPRSAGPAPPARRSRSSRSRMVTPALRKASSRRRCSSVAIAELGPGEDLERGHEGELGAAPVVGGADHRERRLRLAAVAKAHHVLLAVAPDPQLEPFRERVDHRDADAVQAARDLVGVLVELAAGVQPGHDHLGGRDAFALVDVGRDAAAVVAHRDRAVGVEDHLDPVAIAGQRLVDRVVDDLEHHVVQAGAVVGVADVHAGPAAHRLEALEDLDRGGIVGLGRIGSRAGPGWAGLGWVMSLQRRILNGEELGAPAERREHRGVGAGQPGLRRRARRAPRTARARRSGSRWAATSSSSRIGCCSPAAARSRASARTTAIRQRLLLAGRAVARRPPGGAVAHQEVAAVRADRGRAALAVVAPAGGERRGEARLGVERGQLVQPALDLADRARARAAAASPAPRRARRRGRGPSRRRAAAIATPAAAIRLSSAPQPGRLAAGRRAAAGRARAAPWP